MQQPTESALEWSDHGWKTMLDDVHLDRTDAPAMALTEFGAGELERIAYRMRERHGRGENVVVANVRMFGKDPADIRRWIERWHDVCANLPQLSGVVAASIHSEERKRGATATDLAIQEAMTPDVRSLPVAPVNIAVPKGHFWTAGLNGPAAMLAWIAKKEGIPLETIWLLNASYEATFDADAATTIASAVDAGVTPLSVRHDTDPATAARTAARALDWLESGGKTAVSVDTMRAINTLGRNTLSCIRLSDIVAIGGFNPVANALGGMEDHRFRAARILRDAGAADMPTARRNAERSLAYLVPYDDPRLHDTADPALAGQRGKSRAEVRSLLAQAKEGPESMLNRTVVPEERRDFRFVS